MERKIKKEKQEIEDDYLLFPLEIIERIQYNISDPKTWFNFALTCHRAQINCKRWTENKKCEFTKRKILELDDGTIINYGVFPNGLWNGPWYTNNGTGYYKNGFPQSSEIRYSDNMTSIIHWNFKKIVVKKTEFYPPQLRRDIISILYDTFKIYFINNVRCSYIEKIFKEKPKRIRLKLDPGRYIRYIKGDYSEKVAIYCLDCDKICQFMVWSELSKIAIVHDKNCNEENYRTREIFVGEEEFNEIMAMATGQDIIDINDVMINDIQLFINNQVLN